MRSMDATLLPPAIHFFAVGANEYCRKIFTDLRIGLSHALSQLPSFASYLQADEQRPEKLKLHIQPDAGLCFKYHDCRGCECNGRVIPTYAELKRAFFPPSVLDADIFSPCELVHPGPRIPALVLQASFIDGGMLLTSCSFHPSTDARGHTTFLRIWSGFTASASRGNDLPTTALPSAVTDRSTFPRRTKPGQVDSYPEFRLASLNDSDRFAIIKLPDELLAHI